MDPPTIVSPQRRAWAAAVYFILYTLYPILDTVYIRRTRAVGVSSARDYYTLYPMLYILILYPINTAYSGCGRLICERLLSRGEPRTTCPEDRV